MDDQVETGAPASRTPPSFHIVRDTLLEYAERGVFRGFDFQVGDGSARRDESDDPPDAPLRVTFNFFWMGRRPFRIVLSPDGRTITAEGLLPSVGDHPGVPEDLEGFVGERVHASPEHQSGDEPVEPDEPDERERREPPPEPALPPHRRIDPDKARASLVPGAHDDLDLAVSVRNGHHEYAVRKLLNLINEIWVRLQDRHQRYLWDVFEAPME